MDEQGRREADEIRKLPISVLKFLPVPKWRSLSAVLVVIVLLIVFCGVWLYPRIKYDRMVSELNRYESLWNEQEISSYYYKLSQGNAWGDSEVAICVEDGVTTSETIIKSSYYENEQIDYDDCNTVPKLFAVVRHVLKISERLYKIPLFSEIPDSKQGHPYNIIKVTYDRSLGYPVSIFRDYRWGVHLWRYYRVSDFRVLEDGKVSDAVD